MSLNLTREERDELSDLKRRKNEIERPAKAQRKRETKAQRLARAKALLAVVVDNQRRERVRDNAYLAYLRRQRCRIGVDCEGRIDPAHLRYTDRKHDRTNPGMGRKPDDRWATSLCRKHHTEQHAAGDEQRWWASYGMDGSEVAISQYADFKEQP